MLLTLTIANLKLIYRNRQALFWALAFPIIFVAVFGLFRLDRPPTIDMLVVDQAQDQLSQGLVEKLRQTPRFRVHDRTDIDGACQDVQDGEADYMLVIPEGLAEQVAASPGADPAQLVLFYDRGSQTAPIIIGAVQRFVEEANRQVLGVPAVLQLDPRGIQARRLSYFDFVLPGFVGMGVMNYAIIGIASLMAAYREQRILKRLLATPLPVRDFFAGLIAAHLLLAVIQAAIILLVGVLVFGGHVYGNYLYIGLLVVLANLSFLNIGFIVGAFSKSVGAASGLGNAVTLPMMFFSGVFFPTENLPTVLATVVEYLPLAPMLDAMRGVALESRPLWDFPFELGLLGAWVAVTSVVAVRVFRFG